MSSFKDFQEKLRKQLLDKLECDDISNAKKCYHKLVLRYHPDKNQDNKEEATRLFQEIQTTWENLQNFEEFSKKSWEEHQNGIILMEQIKQNLDNFDLWRPEMETDIKLAMDVYQTLLDKMVYLFEYQWTMDPRRWDHLIRIPEFNTLWDTIQDQKEELYDLFFYKGVVPHDQFLEVYNKVFSIYQVEEYLHTSSVLPSSSKIERLIKFISFLQDNVDTQSTWDYDEYQKEYDYQYYSPNW